MQQVRKHEEYVPRNTARAGILKECHIFLQKLAETPDAESVRQKLLQGEFLNHFAYNTRNTLWKIFCSRYLTIQDPWVITDLKTAGTRYRSDSAEFVSLLYLYFILRDKLAFDFVLDVIWPKWVNHDLAISVSDMSDFYEELAEANPHLRNITALSKQKLLSNTLSTLGDFGLLSGARYKTITRPAIPARIAFHLARLLFLEGLSGKEIVNAQDWRIFLWNQQDVTRMLARCAQEGWISYEQAGQTIIFDLKFGVPPSGGSSSSSA